MSLELNDIEIRDILKDALSKGASGTISDFSAWVLMYSRLKNKEPQQINDALISLHLQNLKAEGFAMEGKFDPSEVQISDNNIPKNGQWNSDSYTVFGNQKYSPIQYVRSRLEFFLRYNGIDEEDVMDISIATIEAIENTVKYGDGNNVFIENSIDETKKFRITILNNIKEFDLQYEIERGKYSSNATLMRGVMVMQKLFNHFELEIIDDTQQAKLYAEKNLK